MFVCVHACACEDVDVDVDVYVCVHASACVDVDVDVCACVGVWVGGRVVVGGGSTHVSCVMCVYVCVCVCKICVRSMRSAHVNFLSTYLVTHIHKCIHTHFHSCALT